MLPPIARLHLRAWLQERVGTSLRFQHLLLVQESGTDPVLQCMSFAVSSSGMAWDSFSSSNSRISVAPHGLRIVEGEILTTDSPARPSRKQMAREGTRIHNHEKHARGAGSNKPQPMVVSASKHVPMILSDSYRKSVPPSELRTSQFDGLIFRVFRG